jgi:hypothetical protein
MEMLGVLASSLTFLVNLERLTEKKAAPPTPKMA